MTVCAYILSEAVTYMMQHTYIYTGGLSVYSQQTQITMIIVFSTWYLEYIRTQLYNISKRRYKYYTYLMMYPQHHGQI